MFLSKLRATMLCLLLLLKGSGVLATPVNNASYATLLSRAGTYTNPLNTAKGADPCMRYINGWYYLTSTQNTNIAMKRSTTVNGLKNATLSTLFTDSTAGRNFHFWAPEFWYLNGRWHIYYAVAGNNDDGTHRMHVLQGGTDSSNPMNGAYSYVGPLIPPNRDAWAVDGTILTLSGVNYMVFSSFDGDDQCLWIVRMASPTATSGNAVIISRPTYDWEKVGLNVNEGPEVIQTGGVTRIVFSASYCGGDGYSLGLLTLMGTDPMVASSWEKYNQPLFGTNAANNVYGPGHHFMFQVNNAWYFAYHAKSGSGQSCGDTRTTRVQPFSIVSNRPVFPTAAALSTTIVEPV
ncbi:Arabinanase/levansucrase/invertase [Exidia glandulosa HHB12029]|uniref:Arabinanase/levansucrase/invertase n=1 Tax=Exidia glandulosa HHB12029 TaxID=1314781 RepID=A0A165JC66_EXIGL|nr:Arabinanase/levansucrase/invertase [Exidia glandulosa HHB12029]